MTISFSKVTFLLKMIETKAIFSETRETLAQITLRNVSLKVVYLLQCMVSTK